MALSSQSTYKLYCFKAAIQPITFLISSIDLILQYPLALRPRDRLAVVIPSR